MIDTHAHLDSTDYENDFELVIESALNEGVTSIIIPSVEPDGFSRIRKISHSFGSVYAAYGVHPHDSQKYSSETESLINEYLDDSKSVAVGEIGLDYYYDFSPKNIQQDVFRSQIRIAQKRNLPMIIHNRQADDDIMQILTQEHKGDRINAVMHCFSSTKDYALKAVDLGMHISFTGNITFKKTNLDDVIDAVSMDRIMLETDSPYMTPVPHRGKRNHPAMIKLVAQKISEIKNLKIEEVISMTTKNAQTFFKLFVIALMVICSATIATAQTKSKTIDEDEYEEVEIVSRKYERGFFGIGGFLATNTIVETYKLSAGNKKISYDGIFTPGAILAINPFDFMFITMSYSYSKNEKIVEDNNYLVGPTIHNILQFDTHWIPNPGKVINFYGILGVTSIFNTISKGINERSTTNFGISTGIGLMGNIEWKGVGMFNVFAEWGLLFPMQESSGQSYINGTLVDVNMTKFFSMPKAGIVFYPEIFKNLF